MGNGSAGVRMTYTSLEDPAASYTLIFPNETLPAHCWRDGCAIMLLCQSLAPSISQTLVLHPLVSGAALALFNRTEDG